MRPLELRKDIYWVGGIDWNLRNFHGYITQRGSSYNSYLIVDDKITLIDNVKVYLFEEQLSRISEIIDPAKIDYIIQNHIEMDHSGSLPLIQKHCPDATILATPKGVEGINRHFPGERKLQAVATGEDLNLGKRTITFVPTPMIHWPDNMVSYCPQEKILFSNDAFGQHIASSERFDDEDASNIIMREAERYYANIVLPYSAQVQKALAAVSNLDIDLICPSHGLIWRSHIKDIFREYGKWSSNQVEDRALIIYDTMWGSTEKMARAIQEGFEQKGKHTRLLSLQANHISDIMTEVLTAKYLCIGSPTLNNNILPTVAAFLAYLKGLAPKNRTALAFGSYGWSGQSVGIVEQQLRECGFTILDNIRTQYIPDKKELSEITARLAEQIS